jgi:hypothetical protein
MPVVVVVVVAVAVAAADGMRLALTLVQAQGLGQALWLLLRAVQAVVVVVEVLVLMQRCTRVPGHEMVSPRPPLLTMAVLAERGQPESPPARSGLPHRRRHMYGGLPATVKQRSPPPAGEAVRRQRAARPVPPRPLHLPAEG